MVGPIIGEGDEGEGAGSFVSTEEFDFVAQVGVVHLARAVLQNSKLAFSAVPGFEMRHAVRNDCLAKVQKAAQLGGGINDESACGKLVEPFGSGIVGPPIDE